MKYSKEFVAASSTPLVLSILAQGQSYGYAIIQQVKDCSMGTMCWADGMLYPILHRLEKKGFVAAVWGVSDSGRKRKYYRILPAGEIELVKQRQHWQEINDMLNNFEVIKK